MYTADADLITQAAAVTRLAGLVERAYERLARKSDGVMLAQDPRPVAPDPWGGACSIEDLPTVPGIERRSVVTWAAPPVDHQEAKRRHAEAMARWEAEHGRLMHRAGARDAAVLADVLSDRLTDAIDALAGTPAFCPAGMAAKAEVFLAVMAKLQGTEEREEELARSLARDAVRIGGWRA